MRWPVRSIAERFHEKWIGEPNSGCWLWTDSPSVRGYGRLLVDCVAILAHRISWELHNGPIPEGLFVLHKCDTRLCVNPAHMFLGTHDDNMADMARKGRGRNVPLSGEANPNAILNWETVRSIRSATGGHRAVAAKFGLGEGHVRLIRLHKIWREVA